MTFGRYGKGPNGISNFNTMQVIDGAHKAGLPISRDKVQSGRMTVTEIMAGVNDKHVVRVVKTAHNEVTRTMVDGTVICRLRETDIVKVFADGTVYLDTGGWNTLTTRRHMQNFLNSINFPATIWGDSKTRGILLRDLRGDGVWEIRFQIYVTIFTDGAFWADTPGGY